MIVGIFRGEIAAREHKKLLDCALERNAKAAREILTAARANGFKTLADDGVRLVRIGATGLDELMRVVDLTDRMV